MYRIVSLIFLPNVVSSTNQLLPFESISFLKVSSNRGINDETETKYSTTLTLRNLKDFILVEKVNNKLDTYFRYFIDKCQ